MASYLITGVSRGIGFEFLNQLSKNPDNIVIGFVRNKEETDKKVQAELAGRNNIHIFQADITDYKALKANVEHVSKITNGKLDYLIANAASIPAWSSCATLDYLGESPEQLDQELHQVLHTNVIANVHLFNFYLPLVLRGTAKKVIAITSGYADLENVVDGELFEAMPYSTSKAALNMVVTKYAAQYNKDGVLFLALSPGSVDTGELERATEEQKLQLYAVFKKFLKLYPDFQGPITPEASVTAMLSVIDRSSIANGNNGEFLSHHGNKRWL